jgi:Leucine-rich repeat (LRR) protein
MSAMKELDLRDCKLKSVKENFLIDLPKLEYLYLSRNQITELFGNPFPPNLIHIDLSYNSEYGRLIYDGLKSKTPAFSSLRRLQTLDFSFTKIETRSIETMMFLPNNLIGLSLCYTELPAKLETFLPNSNKLKYLDISGNARFILSSQTFLTFGPSLQVLFARNSNVRNLDWTPNLTNLKFLDLYDNNIHTVTSNSFSHMTNLLKLNLEKNSIGNWYQKLFTQNQQLEILNLRENKLTLLTNDMKEDLSSVKLLAIGNNEIECTCVLQDFMNVLFEATKIANVTALKEVKEIESDEDEFVDKVSVETTRVALGVRNYLRPEYDVISGTYQKYYQMVEQSIEALRIRSPKSKSFSSSRTFVMKSDIAKDESFNDFQTLLFDYNEDDDDYQCINETAKAKQPMIDLDICTDEGKETVTIYDRDRRNLALSLYISIPLVIIISVLVIVVYWKWWYVRYFFVLCKNSAILTFMDDSDNGKDAIVTNKSGVPVETFLYDVFVSYSESNRDWVLDEFISNVEKRESINVCLHERDFQVGYGILENIVSCMDRSRCLLLLVSENFLLSQWCQFEMNLAQHRLLETRRDKLILVLLEDIPERKQPKTLKYLMKTKTYIKWPAGGSTDEKQLFWKRLKKSIVSSKWETESYGSIV